MIPGITNPFGITNQQTPPPGTPIIKPWQVGALFGIAAGVATYFAIDKKVKNNYVKGGAAVVSAGIAFAIANNITKKIQEKQRQKKLEEYFQTISMTAQQQGALMGYTPQQLQQMGMTGQTGTPGAGLPTQQGTVYPGANYTLNVYKTLSNQIYQAMNGWGVDAEKVVSVFGQIKNEADFLSLNEAFGVKEGYTLEQWIVDQLKPNEINGINNHLYKQNIPFGY
jgi:hypothetical protein